ncbi:Metallo-dependent phosphatase-like protein [Lentinula boryana]|uniref:Metallo-dependent phosphatase-like protein n=1 Tax=Lentinula boryana TaxID=40481 RepID=A0ABQ8QFB0_9AGAR|nr:Metallo-dependent phosphatase-like protein [Lentinula boryana]
MVQPDICGQNARVYLKYDRATDIPAKEDGWTRFVCLSDTHSTTHWDDGGRMPRGDILLHAGDLSSYGTVRRLRKTIDWLGSLEGYGAKIIIAGNHDLWLDKNSKELIVFDEVEKTTMLNACQKLMAKSRLKQVGLTYLEFEETTIRDTSRLKEWKIFGSPASPRHSSGAFQYGTKEEAKEINSRIPTHTEILLTHTPPYRTLDKTRKGKHAGCKSLEKRLTSGELQHCRLHVFGHIHEAAGAVIVEAVDGRAERVAVNAAMMHRGKPVVVDLKNL